MARFYAQLCSVIFVLLTVGGFALGNNGNAGVVQLHLTYARDVLDLALLATFIWIGFIAERHLGRIATFVVGGILLLAALVGFVVGDTDTATRSIIGLHFPLAINIFDVIIGLLAVLAGLGTIEDEPARR